MICMEQLSGTCYTKGMRKKEISTFTTVMEKHMVKNRRSSRRERFSSRKGTVSGRIFCHCFIRKYDAREAIELYKSRDASEKLFRSDKSYLGNKSMRVYSDEALSLKVFIQFIALILRSRIY